VIDTLLLEFHFGGWSRLSRPKKERDIDTKIVSYLNGHSWYINTLMAIEKREMNDSWDLDPIKNKFYYFSKTKAT
jgi:hypothetical protein